MTIMVIDNFISRLLDMNVLLSGIFPDNEIAVFADPFLAVQYSMKHEVDIAFLENDLQPISCITVSKLIRRANENAKVWLIADDLRNISVSDTEKDFIDGYLEYPLNREKIETIMPLKEGILT